jgi:multidrug efflux pump
MKVELNDVFDTLQVFLGGYYVNDFNRFGRTWQVNIQADALYRMSADRERRLIRWNSSWPPESANGR